jgi:putative cardiolipin synthase
MWIADPARRGRVFAHRLRAWRLAAAWIPLFCTACATLPEQQSRPDSIAIAPGQASPIDVAIGPLEAARPSESGLMILDEGRPAFAARAHLTGMAQRSLDVQTYIWNTDLAGRYLANEILKAADRGVHVRLLLDDFNARSKNDPLVTLDLHENIEIRLYNPFAWRYGSIGAYGEMLHSFRRLNRRMHLKNWIADNRVAISGGRNVGDEYFAASSESNFADMDVLMVGDIVRDCSSVFDRYWNSDVVYPISLLSHKPKQANSLEAMRATLSASAETSLTSRYATDLRDDTTVRRLLAGTAPFWGSD